MKKIIKILFIMFVVLVVIIVILKPWASPIVITSPEGGEQWAQGTKHAILWNDNNPIKNPCTTGTCPMIPIVDLYSIYYVYNNQTHSIIDDVLINKSTGNIWSIPSTLATGTYKIKICKYVSSVCNTSKDFNIITKTN